MQDDSDPLLPPETNGENNIMTEQTKTVAAEPTLQEMIQTAIAAQMQQAAPQPQTAPQPQGGLAGWEQASPTVALQVEKVLVPVRVSISGQTIDLMFQFDGAIAANPQTLLNAVETLMKTVPVKAWTPKGGGNNAYSK